MVGWGISIRQSDTFNPIRPRHDLPQLPLDHQFLTHTGGVIEVLHERETALIFEPDRGVNDDSRFRSWLGHGLIVSEVVAVQRDRRNVVSPQSSRKKSRQFQFNQSPSSQLINNRSHICPYY